jgi:hypothetical protein
VSEWSVPDVIGSVGGIVGVVAAAVLGTKSLRVSRAALTETRRTADETRRAADAGETAARASETSAVAAREAAREAADVGRMEREREHDRLSPGPVPTIDAVLVWNPESLARNLFGTVTVPRDYRVLAEAVHRGGVRMPLGLDRVLHAGRPYRFHIERWPVGRTEPEMAYVAFRFWVPADGDDVEAWKCPCDRAMIEGGERGHWEWRAPISYVPSPAIS